MKKSFILFALFCCFSIPSIAQLLTTTPSFPKDTSNVAIVVDCAKGNQGLFGYGNTNDVYVHVGVITNLSTGPTDWRYVKFTWGTTNAQAQAVSLGNNRYQYIINNPRSFFAVPAGETIQKITFLLRNGTGSQVQRNADGTDMYIPIYTNALAGKYIEPPLEPKFIPVPEPINKVVGQRVKVSYLTNNLADLSLFFNGIAVNAVSSSNSIIDSPLLSTSGNQQIVVRSIAGAVTISDTINFFVAPPTNILPQPAGTVDGINYESGDSSVTFVVYAPDKARVTVIGDFNNWIETSNYVMNRTPDGLRHWVRITGLAPGTEYAYQFLVDGVLKIADPYSQKLLDPQNDGFITAITYPNLKPYPSGKTTGIVSVLQTAEPGYTWQINNFQRPDKRGLIIYETLIRDFIAAHDFKTIKDTLAYLKNLGVNAIELMPVNEFEGNISWGYNTSFQFAPDKYYGPKNRLKELIDECHKQGIAVILDLVLNHHFGQSPMVQLYFDNSTGRPAANNPWFNPTARHAFNVGYDMNHESLATRYYFSRVVEHWLKEYKVDGFRFDLSKGFTQVNTCDANGNNCNVGAWGAYDASRVAIWKRYYDSCQLKSAGSYVILEHFADNPEEKELSDYGMMFWGNLNHAFNEATMGFLPQSNFEWAMSTARGWTQPAVVAYMESHDEERLMYKNLNFGNSSGSYTTRDLNTGLRRNEMAAAFFFAMPGPKMIWQFGEQGYDYSINYCTNGTVNNACRLDPKPIKWDYLQVAARKRLTDVYTGLLKLRAHTLYRTAFLTNRVDYNLASGFKWLRLTTDTSNLLVVGNFDVTAASGQVTFQNAGTWYNYLTGQTFNATGAAQTINLQPGEYAVYVNRNVTNILTPVREVIYEGKKIRLSVAPNPVRQSANIEYEIPESGQVSISVMDGMGRKVSQLYSGFRAKGVYKMTLQDEFLLNRAAKGVYFLQLEFRSKKLVQKLVLQ